MNTLSPLEKEKIYDLISESATDGLTGTIQLWDTLTIPYISDPGLSDDLKKRFKQAAKEIYDKTEVRLVSCNQDAIKKKSVRAFMYLGKFSDFCKEPGAACSKGIGMKLKTGLDKLSKPDEEAEKAFAASGAPMGFKESNNVMVIAHEFLHRLGLAHQHQSPYANKFIKVDQSDKDNCAPNGIYWLPYYDPASVMHYGLQECNKMELDCESSPKGGNRYNLKCKAIDEQISKYVCLYGTQSSGNKCFQRPEELLGGPKLGPAIRYSDNKFGQRECLSMLDQAWLLSRYAIVEKDEYGLEKMIADGLCEAN
ncbi:M12 family metallopeptidase [Mesorhizobium yinganensis]|uniref:M12 family metallopeptidase n=1 Tax=Mesorhizobium yinganensis TaxID=3157707 RepID=UPI0032B86E7A